MRRPTARPRRSPTTGRFGHAHVADGETSKTIPIVILDDTVDEAERNVHPHARQPDRRRNARQPRRRDGDDHRRRRSDSQPVRARSTSAEGATGFFDLEFAIGNPNAVPAPIRASFLKADGSTVTRDLTLLADVADHDPRERDSGAGERRALDGRSSRRRADAARRADDVLGSPKLLRRPHRAAGEGARRQMVLRRRGRKASSTPTSCWPTRSRQRNTATVTFLIEAAVRLSCRTYLLLATSRMNVFAGAIPELVGQSFGFTVTFAQPGAAERSMYFGSARFWDGGHASVGVAAPATSWYPRRGRDRRLLRHLHARRQPERRDGDGHVHVLLDTGS